VEGQQSLNCHFFLKGFPINKSLPQRKKIENSFEENSAKNSGG